MRHFLLVLLVLVATPLAAQRYAFIPYGPEDGLPQSQVRCLASTHDGWLWVGTNQGLSRFDGQEFHPVAELGKEQINVLWTAEDGTLYAGFSGGIAVREGQSFVIHPLQVDTRDAEVRHVGKGLDGNLWAGTVADGIWMLHQGEWSRLALNGEQSEVWECRGLVRTPSHDVVATKETVYVRSQAGGQTGAWEVLHRVNENTAILNLHVHSNGAIWVATRGEGVIRLDENGVQRFGSDQYFVSDDASQVCEASDGTLWVASRYGVSHIQSQNQTLTSGDFLNLAAENGLPTEQITCTVQDYEGNIWLGTQGKGLLLFAGAELTTLTTEEGLPSDLVMNISQDAGGNVWVSTYDAGAVEFRDDKPTGEVFTVPGGNNRVWCSLKDSRGAMWFGTSNGLWRFDEGTWRSWTKDDGLHSRVILSLYEDAEGRIWVGSYRGINWVGPDEQVTAFPYEDSWEWKKIRSIREDAEGNVWCAGSLGIFQVSSGAVRHWTEADGLPDISCIAAMPSADGRVWIASRAGLAVLDGSAIQSIASAGVDEHTNFAVEWEDELWVGTNNGVFHAPLEGLGPGTPFTRLGTRDGLGSRETNQNAWWIDDNNRFWVGTTEGVNRLDPSLAGRAKAQVPKLALNEVRLNLLPTDWTARGVELDPASALPKGLVVGHKDNHFTFQYRGFGMRYPEALSYQYRLNGFDDTWRPVTTAEFATYSNLPYRNFDFQVRARVGAGPWSEVHTFGFAIRPPFWMTWWFYLLEALAAVALIWFIFDRRRRMVTAKLEKEKFELRSRMLALEQQNLNSSMNRHFVFNALNSIQYYINRKDRIAANKYLSAFARLIRKNLDSSADNLTSLRDEIERLELYLQLEHMRFHDKFEYAIHVDPSVDADEVQVPAMLLQPFLENSIWHGILPMEQPGLVEVNVSREQGGIAVIIRDDGIGIDTSLARKSGAESHISQGMNITSNRLEVMRQMTQENLQLIGPYEVKDADNTTLGTEVKIILPLRIRGISVN